MRNKIWTFLRGERYAINLKLVRTTEGKTIKWNPSINPRANKGDENIDEGLFTTLSLVILMAIIMKHYQGWGK